MKLSYRQVENFVKKPDPKARVILVYGPDSGLMKERAQIMGKSVVPDLNDPFNVASLTGDLLAEDPARLSDEAHAISMMGGDRLIRVDGASDKLTTLLKDYLESPSSQALVILEAGELGPRSSLRKLCEKAPNAAAVPCYVEDERDLSRLIRETMQAEGLQIQPDAVSFLAAAIAGDRGKVRSELEKVVLYKGDDSSPVSLEDAQACCGAAGAVSLDDLVYSVAGRNPDKAIRSYARLMAEGVNFVVILRTLQNHFRKLHFVHGRMEQGDSLDQAAKALRPPLFFKQESAFKGQVNKWNMHALNKTLANLTDLEARCKQTGAPVETLCGQAIVSMSRSR